MPKEIQRISEISACPKRFKESATRDSKKSTPNHIKVRTTNSTDGDSKMKRGNYIQRSSLKIYSRHITSNHPGIGIGGK